MEFRPQLAQQLATLTNALDVPGADVQAMLEVLLDDITLAVPSCTGLRISVTAGPVPTVVEVRLPGGATRASLHLPLPGTDHGSAITTVNMFADHPGAFTALAADARLAWGLDGEVVIDGHLAGRPLEAEDGSAGPVTDAAVVQQAIGFLIDRGHPPEAALAELHRQAQDRGVEIVAHARQLLTGGDDVDDNDE